MMVLSLLLQIQLQLHREPDAPIANRELKAKLICTTTGNHFDSTIDFATPSEVTITTVIVIIEAGLAPFKHFDLGAHPIAAISC